MPDHTYELFGIDLHPNTSTHSPCQVKGCDIEWAIATGMTAFDDTKADRMDVCLCNGHHRLFRKLSEVDPHLLAQYRDELDIGDQEQP